MLTDTQQYELTQLSNNKYHNKKSSTITSTFVSFVSSIEYRQCSKLSRFSVGFTFSARYLAHNDTLRRDVSVYVKLRQTTGRK